VPLAQFLHQIEVPTRGKGLYEITGVVGDWVAGLGVNTGLLTVFVQHTSASLTIQENADPDVMHDLNQFFNRLVEEDNRLYRHTVEGPDDMPAHIRAALTLAQLSVPVERGVGAGRMARDLPVRASRRAAPPAHQAALDRRRLTRVRSDRAAVVCPLSPRGSATLSVAYPIDARLGATAALRVQ
jgi:secondary thiamine-phosphate synthase enzyme